MKSPFRSTFFLSALIFIYYGGFDFFLNSQDIYGITLTQDQVGRSIVFLFAAVWHGLLNGLLSILLKGEIDSSREGRIGAILGTLPFIFLVVLGMINPIFTGNWNDLVFYFVIAFLPSLYQGYIVSRYSISKVRGVIGAILTNILLFSNIFGVILFFVGP